MRGRWGELQGLYTAWARGRPPRVQRWMRTARQRRVVASLFHHLRPEPAAPGTPAAGRPSAAGRPARDRRPA